MGNTLHPFSSPSFSLPKRSADGELVIDSAIDGAVVNVWHEGRIVLENWSLTAGTNRVSIPAGEIDVQRAASVKQDFEVDQEQRVLSPRGELTLRVLRRTPQAATESHSKANVTSEHSPSSGSP